MKKAIACLVGFIFLLSAVAVVAEIKSLIKEYTYQASEIDSKTSCRAIALEQVKRELLEELEPYVEATTIVQDAQIQKDEIIALCAGVVQAKVLDEKWDGKEYWLKAEVNADPDEVAASIDKLRNDQQLADELAQTQAEKEDALNEVERLKAELAQSNEDKEKLAQYNDAVNQLQAADSFEQGTAYTVAGDYEQATKSYDRVIYLRPDDPRAYFGRGIVFIYLGNYDRATNDLDRAMVLRPANTDIYFQRAAAYKNYRENRIIPGQRFAPPFVGRNLRPVAPPRVDPLQKFLDRKQTEHKLVRVNPFQPRPAVRKDPRLVQQRQIRDQQYRRELEEKRNLKYPNRQKAIVGQPVKPDVRKGTTIPSSGIDRNQQWEKQKRDEQYRRESEEKQKLQYNRDKEKPVIGTPVKPDIYKKSDVPPPANLERKPRVDGERGGIQKRDLKEGSFVREPVKPEVRKQGNVPQPLVEKKPPVVQPKREVSTPKAPQKVQQQTVKTPKQIKEEELEKASHRK